MSDIATSFKREFTIGGDLNVNRLG
ncbi:MAG: hypothetical protein JWR54_311, partial [Mucilaginibacter sp.]|nr:hypothetical protein [Mucilaginibacter sp.]